MTAKLIEISIPTISLVTIEIGGVDWMGAGASKPKPPTQDCWLWDNGERMQWDDGGYILI